ncbi:hypothetical protein [Mycobacterium sp. SP-6446]|uniref:hypothetical protein n=1 Tax=Mycobacterium sp. SP-6446 TaxID=1834162 RepID=UPI00096C16FB|nr:hypothetical protein [Mycobacterium sp. SP-6446]OMC08442.1 hypothetical protein A5736_06575 [Mycobacterium sp. SP-6446]
MTTTSLTHAEAQAKIKQIDQAMGDALVLKNKMENITLHMTSSSWQGNQARTFATKMQGYNDDFNAIINQLSNVAETGKSNMMTLVNHDSH